MCVPCFTVRRLPVAPVSRRAVDDACALGKMSRPYTRREGHSLAETKTLRACLSLRRAAYPPCLSVGMWWTWHTALPVENLQHCTSRRAANACWNGGLMGSTIWPPQEPRERKQRWPVAGIRASRLCGARALGNRLRRQAQHWIHQTSPLHL